MSVIAEVLRLDVRTEVLGMSTLGPLADIAAERQRQDEKWGEQNHPDGTGRHTQPLEFRDATVVHNDFAFLLAAVATVSTFKRARDGSITWTDILLEEVFEALAESDPVKLREELIQVAAVATQWVEAIDRREVPA